MANSRFRQTLTAALPVREVKQPHSRELTAPDVYAFSSVLAQPNSSDGAGSNTLTQLLQTTLKDTTNAVTEANKQLSALLPVQQQNVDTVNQNTQALVNNTASKSGSGSSALSTVGSFASGIVGGGSILTPIISGLFSLFGGHSSSQQPTFTAFTMPAPIHLDTTLSGGSQQQPAASAQGVQSNSGESTQVAAPPIQIQVNAIDSRSFLDHSDQIAQAVRLALLNSHPLADVIAEI
jgi:hypothetical protein